MLQLSLYKIFIFFLSIFFIFEATKKFLQQRQGQTFLKFLIQAIVWSAIAILVFFPKLAQILSFQLGFGENLNTLIFTGFVFIFLILFKIISVIERMEQNISEIVRQEALEKIKTAHAKKSDNSHAQN